MTNARARRWKRRRFRVLARTLAPPGWPPPDLEEAQATINVHLAWALFERGAFESPPKILQGDPHFARWHGRDERVRAELAAHFEVFGPATRRPRATG